MARINVDSKFFCDPRVAELAAEVDEDLWSIEIRLIHLWHSCYQQRSAIFSYKSIDAICKIPNFSKAMILCGLAEELDGKVRVKGVDERIEYLIKNYSDMGKKSAEARKKKTGTAQPVRKLEHDSNTTFEPSSNSRSRNAEPSSSSSFSSSNSISSSISRGGEKTHPLLEIYKTLYINLYKREPLQIETVFREIKYIASLTSIKDAEIVIRNFFASKNPYYLEQHHRPDLMLADLEKLRGVGKSGALVTKQKAKNFFA